MIPIIKPNVRFDEVAADLEEIFESGILTSGRYVAEFEERVAREVGVAAAVSTTSATTALHLALAACGVGPGDEVLVSDFTFPATGNVVAQLGARPVMVDCAAGSFALDVDHAESLVTERTKAVLPVDPFGQPAPLPALESLATRHGLALVEDAACALGASIAGRAAGSFPAAAAFSFHPRKVVTTGEGGMITTDDGDLADRLRRLRGHGAERASVGMTFVEHGYNYRLGEVPAAIGLAQMRRLDEILDDRRRTAERYRVLLGDIDGVEVPWEAPDERWTFQSFVVVVPRGVRDGVVASLREAGVETTLGTYAMHAHPAFARYGYQPGDLPRSYDAQETTLTLPLLPNMSTSDVETVVEELATAVGR